MSIRNSQNGVSLIAAIAVIVILAVLGASLASLVGVTSRNTLDFQYSLQALNYAQAGLNWYKMQLKDVNDWSAITPPAAQSIGSGTFTISINPTPTPTKSQVRFTSTGKITYTDKDGTTKTVQRTMEETVKKAMDYYDVFCLFYGNSLAGGLPLTFSGTTVTGSIWSNRGVSSGSPGGAATVYHPQGTTVPGGVNEVVTPSVIPMPIRATTFFDNLISNYNALITADTSNTDLNITTSQTFTVSGIMNYRNITINPPANGTINIVGNGTLVANGAINLNSSGASGSVRTLNIKPSSGGTISILSNGMFTINTTNRSHRVAINQNHTPNGNSAVNLYCKSDLNSRYLRISNANSYVEAAMIIGNRRVIVDSGADVYASTLYVNYPGDASNNYLQVTGAGTIIGSVAMPCSLITFGQSGGNSQSLELSSGVSVTGFVYQWNLAGAGYTFINTATVRGVIYADGFRSDTISGLNLTGDPSLVFDDMATPQGFSTVSAYSWDDV
jgi:hypothetical protein